MLVREVAADLQRWAAEYIIVVDDDQNSPKTLVQKCLSARCKLYSVSVHGHVDDERVTELWHARQKHFRGACCSMKVV